MTADWFYADAKNQQQGPVSAAALADAYRNGAVTAESLVWREGLDGWVPLRQVAAQLGVSVASGPPPLPRPASAGGRIVKPSGSSSSTAMVIVVVIIFGGLMAAGILAAIAIPAYQDFLVRSKVINAIMQADAVKMGVTEYFADKQLCPDNRTEGFKAPADYASTEIASIDIGRIKQSKRCAIDITLNNLGSANTKDLTIRWTLEEDGHWSVSSTLPSRYLPMSMRNASAPR